MTGVVDEEPAWRSGDPGGMLDAFAATGRQLMEALDGGSGSMVPFGGDLRTVTFCAVGGSAAACDAVAASFGDRSPGAMTTVRGYRVPGSSGAEDLAVCVSYSGNTEETVAALAAARARGSTVVAVTGGGVLAERAGSAEIPVVAIPADAPVPRAGLGALVGGVLAALAGAGVLPGVREEAEAASRTLDDLAAEIGPARPTETNEAKDLAEWIGDRMPVVWGSEGVSAAAAWRWKTAFNENAKVPAFASSLPELDHHEVVGWVPGRGKGFCLLVLREPGEHPTVQARLDATFEEIEASGLEWREVHARGDDPLSRCLSLEQIGDMASTYHAIGAGLDPAEMESLVRIKSRLAGGPG